MDSQQTKTLFSSKTINHSQDEVDFQFSPTRSTPHHLTEDPFNWFTLFFHNIAPEVFLPIQEELRSTNSFGVRKSLDNW